MKDGTEGRGRLEGLGGGTSTLKGPCHSGSHYRWTTTLMSQREGKRKRERGRERKAEKGAGEMGLGSERKTNKLWKIEIRMSWNQATEILQARCLLGVFLLCFHRSVDVLLLFSSVHSSINNSNKEKPQHLCWMMHQRSCASVFQWILFVHTTVGKKITEMSKKNDNLKSNALF